MGSRLLPSAAFLVATCVLAAGCGGGNTHKAAAPSPKACHLSAAQRHGIARARADIRQLRRIQAPLHTFTERGTPAQQRVTGEFLADLTRVKLPIDARATLIHKAKAAVGLCGQCFQGLEAEEPVVSGRLGEARCT